MDVLTFRRAVIALAVLLLVRGVGRRPDTPGMLSLGTGR